MTQSFEHGGGAIDGVEYQGRRRRGAATLKELTFGCNAWRSEGLREAKDQLRLVACRSQPLRRHCRLRPARMGSFSAEIASF